MSIRKHTALLMPVVGLLIALAAPLGALAHCDSLDGPVVKAAQEALRTRNASLVLVWVQSNDEPELKTAFRRTLAVRKLGREARELADMYFFETVVRIHRSGEGEPYTGLKPAGRDLGPAIPAADRAIDSGSSELLLKLFPAAAHAGIVERFGRVIAKKEYTPNDVAAGREYVKAYVEFIHYVEELYDHTRADSQEPNQLL